MPDYGIDVSGFNTVTSWSAVLAAGNTWSWSKATQGSSYTNPLFASQFNGSRTAGLVTGAYHFPDPNVSVAANVAHFVAVARPLGAFTPGAMLPLLDLENDQADGITWTAASANAFIPAFRDQLRAATGQRKLCVYASQSWWATGMLRPNDWADADVFLCAARYGVQPAAVGWSHPRLAVHQYTDIAATPGVTKPTDRSVTVGGFTAAALTVGATGKDDDMGDLVYCQTEQLDDKGQKTGIILKGLYSGGYLSGLGASDIAVWDAKVTAGEIECTWITWGLWQDWDGKGNRQIVVSQQLLAAQQATNDALTKALAVVPAGPGGGLSADQLAAAVAAGVRAGLDGVTETTTLHKPA